MTQTPAVEPLPSGTVVQIPTKGAPLPAAPVHPQVTWTGKLTVGRYEFDLVTKLSAVDMVNVQEAQDSRKLRELLNVMPRMVHAAQRQQLHDYIWSDPDEDIDKVGIDEAFEALGNALEQINNRPSDK